MRGACGIVSEEAEWLGRQRAGNSLAGDQTRLFTWIGRNVCLHVAGRCFPKSELRAVHRLPKRTGNPIRTQTQNASLHAAGTCSTDGRGVAVEKRQFARCRDIIAAWIFLRNVPSVHLGGHRGRCAVYVLAVLSCQYV